MARKENPIPAITHTEIYARALRQIISEIDQWRVRCEGLPAEQFEKCTEELQHKKEALKVLYYIETGIEYDA